MESHLEALRERTATYRSQAWKEVSVGRISLDPAIQMPETQRIEQE
jgi:hypothetical protein